MHLQASDLLLSLWHDTGVLPSLDQLWLERRKEVDLMPDHMATWSEAARQEGEKMLNTIASLLVNMGSQIGIQPTAAAWRGIFKVRVKDQDLYTPCDHLAQLVCIIPYRTCICRWYHQGLPCLPHPCTKMPFTTGSVWHSIAPVADSTAGGNG